MEIEFKDFVPSDYKRIIKHSEISTKVSIDIVLHFTRKFNALYGILESGFRPSICDEFPIYQKDHYSSEVMTAALGETEPAIADKRIPMVCFCDIPKRSRFKHMKQYGKYGIGLKKAWAISNYLCPVHYVPKDSGTHVVLNQMTNVFDLLKSSLPLSDEPVDLRCNALLEKYDEYLRYVKVYQDSKTKVKYYDEREWRFIPDSTLDFKNPDNNLQFDINDIDVIYVNTAQEKRIITKLLKSKYGVINPRLIKLNK